MVGFRLPRKRKKQYKKDNPLYRVHWTRAGSAHYRRCHYEWFYKRRMVEVRSMLVIINYPQVATREQLADWYREHYPGDEKVQHIIRTMKVQLKDGKVKKDETGLQLRRSGQKRHARL